MTVRELLGSIIDATAGNYSREVAYMMPTGGCYDIDRVELTTDDEGMPIIGLYPSDD